MSIYTKSQSRKYTLSYRNTNNWMFLPPYQPWYNGEWYWPSLDVVDFRVGDKVPEFRRKIRQHENATGLLQGEKWYYHGGYGTVYGSSYKNFVWGTGQGDIRLSGHLVFLYKDWCPIPSYSDLADQQARAKFYKKAKAKQTAFRGLTFLGELGETLHMLRNPGRSLRRGLDDYLGAVTKRARGAKRSSLGRIVGDTWLEYAFGWMPMINDIKDAGAALNQRLERYQGSYAKVTATGKEERYDFAGSVRNQGYSILGVDWDAYRRSKFTHKYYGEVESVCPNPLQADMTLFGTNWREIVPTAWELMPYSFLVDYFTNIGDLIDAWSVRSSSIRWVSQTRRADITVTSCNHTVRWEPWKVGCVGPDTSMLSCSPAVLRGKAVDRVGLSQVPLPSLTWKMPGMSTKWLNLAALAPNLNRTRKLLFS